ncbi:MAG TPA: PEP-CTERM sorting domain-containing protein [Fimbriimonas sp.]|nr:PEP-CTERM sorting domain-containing protein [Fimbriimonas sp.]
MTKSIFTLGAIALGVVAQAQQINSRNDLNSWLVSSVTDDFETFVVGDGDATVTDAPTVAWDTVVSGQGPNLVNFGASYSDSGGSNIQWNGNGYYALNSRTILASTDNLFISFAPGIQAFGLDARSFQGYGYQGTMSVYSNVTLLGTVNFSVGGFGGDSTFVGWKNAGGITHAILDATEFGFSPLIDDHTYGATNAVPEPASMTALALGGLALLRRRRSTK